jgi:hypothetical protein
VPPGAVLAPGGVIPNLRSELSVAAEGGHDDRTERVGQREKVAA